ncbi:hypothetical protein [Streptomyces armeniacus]|uniref:hypothetical protein n=1 Tax=Streptomyces armeniacus TaxID=83291 RepID=UPI001AD81E74|nr:hypothetical protein [Streptomyces armeniacus]
MRDVQGTLDDAQAARSRMLAAFAVTVRNDGAVADLLGLTEREVRIARRTVGKEDARAVADELLTAPAANPPTAEEQHLANGVPDGSGYAQSQTQPQPQVGQTQLQAHVQAQQAQAQAQQTQQTQAQQAQAQAQVTGAGAAAGAGTEPVWSAAMDAVLVGGWQTGVDLQVLAAEFGLDLSRLVTRAQQLSVQGRLGPYRGAYAPEEAAGRHRRGSGAVQTDAYGIPTQQATSGWDVTAVTDPTQAGWNAAVQQAWGQDPNRTYTGDTAGGTHDWDGILHEWGDNPAVQENPAQSYQQSYQQQAWPQYT